MKRKIFIGSQFLSEARDAFRARERSLDIYTRLQGKDHGLTKRGREELEKTRRLQVPPC